jgi:hypothetical protein
MCACEALKVAVKCSASGAVGVETDVVTQRPGKSSMPSTQRPRTAPVPSGYLYNTTHVAKEAKEGKGAMSACVRLCKRLGRSWTPKKQGSSNLVVLREGLPPTNAVRLLVLYNALNVGGTPINTYYLPAVPSTCFHSWHLRLPNFNRPGTKEFNICD